MRVRWFLIPELVQIKWYIVSDKNTSYYLIHPCKDILVKIRMCSLVF